MIAFKVPPLGESIVEGTIARWMKQEGEAVAAGDTLLELETDKVTVEVPSPGAGVLSKRLKQEGDVVKVDEPLGEIDESKVGSASESEKVSASAKESASESVKPTAPVQAAAAPERKVSPAAQRVAAEQNVDVSKVQGTGRGGVVSKPDVIEATKTSAPAGSTPAAAPAAAPAQGSETREKMSTRRKRIAEHLLEAQHATAHLTTFNEVDMSAVMAVRERLKERVEKEHGVKLTFMPFFVKAACLALKAYPTVNAQVDGDSIVYKHYVHMGVAVASEQGLVVPNIKNADQKGMIEVTRDTAAIAKRARDGKLTMDDLTGGTFTITNGGVFGSLVSTPIINYPQVAILGLHKTQDRPVAIAGKVEIRPMMYIALSYDHRIIDGQQAVLFLVKVKELIEDPASMLVN